MATFKAGVQNKRADGTYNVRIRVIHLRRIKWMSTNIFVTQADMTKSLKIKNKSVLAMIDDMIAACMSLCNDLGYSLLTMDIDQLVDLLKRRLSGEDNVIRKEMNTHLEIDVNAIKRDIIESSEFAAMQIIKDFYPDLDIVSYAQACVLVGTNGRSWLKKHIADGNICPIRKGTTKNSRIYFSRIEIHALKKAEELKSKSVLALSKSKN